MTTGILVSVKMKNRLYEDYLKDPMNEKLLTFKEYRNRLNKIKKSSERAYYVIEGNMKWAWIKVNETLGHKKEKNQLKMKNFSGKLLMIQKKLRKIYATISQRKVLSCATNQLKNQKFHQSPNLNLVMLLLNSFLKIVMKVKLMK